MLNLLKRLGSMENSRTRTETLVESVPERAYASAYKRTSYLWKFERLQSK
ncbi:unnamed protein product [Trichobilharzia regenti]|nr:unnamed protein product [Trichobilharzia regenti]